MEPLHNIYGLIGSSMIIVLVVTSLLRFVIGSKVALQIVAAAVFVFSFVPIGGTPLNYFVRGATGDLAIPTLTLCLMALVNSLRSPTNTTADAHGKLRPASCFSGGSLTAFFVIIAITGSVFYPMTMGFTVEDPYAWGYQPRGLLMTCLLLVVLLELAGRRTAATLIVLPVAAYATGLMESTNLWDYLLDPILFLTSLAGSIAAAVKCLRSARLVMTSSP